MNVFIVNTHSTLNSGDAGIVLGEVQFLKKYFRDVRIALTSRTPEIDRALYNPMGIDVFPPIIPAPSVFARGEQRLLRSLSQLSNVSAKRGMLSRIGRSDVVISNGGGYFWSNRSVLPGPMFFQNYLHLRIASVLGKPILFFPQSFGPFDNAAGPRMLKTVLGKNNVIKVLTRERGSFDFLNSLLEQRDEKARVRMCPDMAFFLPGEERRMDEGVSIDLPRPRIAVTVREWHFPETKKGKRAERRKAYLSACRKVCERVFKILRGSILIFAQARGPGAFESDVPLSRSLFYGLRQVIPDTHLSFVELPLVVSPFFIINLLSRVDLIIATRFHSAIFALLSGVPAISIGYQPKSKGAMELLDLENYCIDIAEVEAGELFGLVEDILGDRDAISRNILKKVDLLRGDMEGELQSCFRSFL